MADKASGLAQINAPIHTLPELNAQEQMTLTMMGAEAEAANARASVGSHVAMNAKIMKYLGILGTVSILFDTIDAATGSDGTLERGLRKATIGAASTAVGIVSAGIVAEGLSNTGVGVGVIPFVAGATGTIASTTTSYILESVWQ